MPDELTLAEYLAIPYVLDVQAVEGADGLWMCRAEYEELPGCVTEDRDAIEALERVERLRVEIIEGLVEAGLDVPTPRPPLAA
jgi:hypothetical protein